jgi:hemerythrin-like domain-containing protein
MHHSIEEEVLFPYLAKKMPEFTGSDPGLLQQHKEIHAGMDQLEEYLQSCRAGEVELRLEEVKRLMDVFAAVLWTHLDEEVRTLGAENMRRYWTLAELKKFPV